MAKKNVATKPNKESKEKKDNSTSTTVVGFFQETKQELSKVVWPSRQQLLSESVAVILMVTLVATVIYLVDNLFSWLAKQPFLFGG